MRAGPARPLVLRWHAYSDGAAMIGAWTSRSPAPSTRRRPARSTPASPSSSATRRAWFYDSPALYTDVWVQLCRAAERTERIALGPGVTVPSLRHPMTTAAAIATLVDLAGAERVDGRHRLRLHRAA